MAQSIFSNVIIATTSRFAVILLGLLATILTLRVISVEMFGVYSLVLTIGTFIQLFADFGLYITASRELGATQGKMGSIMQHIVSLRLTLLLSFFCLGIVAFISIPDLRDMALVFMCIAMGLIFQSLSQLMMGVFQVYGHIWKATVGDIIGRGVQVALLWYVMYSKQEGALMWVAVALMLSMLATFVVHSILVPHKRGMFPQVSIAAWRRIIKSSWPIALMLVLNVIYFRSDIVILSLFRSNDEVGWYGLAYKIIENGLFFPAMLGGLLLPHMSSALALSKNQRVQTILSQGLSLALYGAIIVSVILIVFASPVVAFISGRTDLYVSISLLRILTAALAIMFIGNIFGYALIALSRQRTLAVLYSLLVVCNIGANIVLIPMFGAVAAAWTTVATEAVAMCTAAYIVYRSIQYRLPVKNIGIALGAGCIATYIGAILPSVLHIGFRLAFVGLLYAGVGYVFGLWNKATLSILRNTSSV